ncbi:MAG: fibrobacter succinogenes major paralogous domain-containing protein [Bacteroidetes bacterium]|nr:fibrobacter succinogenes major paralogous domain-containing protein [Bacteroidota bacterium]
MEEGWTKKQAAWCYYNNDPKNEATFGKLYNWYAINDPRCLAPEGWRITTDEDWTKLINSLGGSKIANKKLKSSSNWNNSRAGNDEIGLSIQPGGLRFDFGDFGFIQDNALFWSATTKDETTAFYRYFDFPEGEISKYAHDKNHGFSVRCIKGEQEVKEEKKVNPTYVPKSNYNYYLDEKVTNPNVKITKGNFNSDIMNKVLLRRFNEFRRFKGLDTLVFSQVVFDSLSYTNCLEVAQSGRFYHPKITERWKHPILREMIVSEAESTLGGEVKRHSSGLPWLDTWENAFRSLGSFTNYNDIAKLAIESWEKSSGHKRVQNMEFKSGNLPGLFSCHSIYAENQYIYIYINFVKLHRD